MQKDWENFPNFLFLIQELFFKNLILFLVEPQKNLSNSLIKTNNLLLQTTN
jgi:hypothetical protein